MAAIADFTPFIGEHCETTATGCLLHAAGIPISEPMLFGLGQGLAYGIFTFKNVPNPIIGGRSRPLAITKVAAPALNVKVDFRDTRSLKRAWANVADFVDNGQPVGVQINCRFLDYFTTSIDFAGHFVALYGYDDDQVHVVDTAQQGGVNRTNREQFSKGRHWRGPMAGNATTWTVSAPSTDIDWSAAVQTAIAQNARDYLAPPIRNFGAAGIRKTAALVADWPDRYSDNDIATAGALMERGGTGGGLFRSMYRDFLLEAGSLLNNDRLVELSHVFDDISARWTSIASHLEAVATDGPAALRAAGAELLAIADIEERAVEELAAAAADIASAGSR